MQCCLLNTYSITKFLYVAILREMECCLLNLLQLKIVQCVVAYCHNEMLLITHCTVLITCNGMLLITVWLQYSVANCAMECCLLSNSVLLIVQYNGAYCAITWCLLCNNMVLIDSVKVLYSVISEHLKYISNIF